MRKNFKVLSIILFLLACLLILGFLLINGKNVAVLNPAGTIADSERQLIILGCFLSLIVVLPVYFLTIYIVFKYRADNIKAKYTPEWDHNKIIEGLWFGIPSAIILVLSIITWVSSHSLDPYKPLSSNINPITIQVVSLDWKWLFIYPKYNIASVNYFQFPVNTPVDFQITSDTVMNSFWIPNLGSQIYAMPGMNTQLHLIAQKRGRFPGSSANISGNGFSGMTFTAQSTSNDTFHRWINSIKKDNKPLNNMEYLKLSKPSSYNAVQYFSSVQVNLFKDIVDKYMIPLKALNANTSSMYNMNMKGNG